MIFAHMDQFYVISWRTIRIYVKRMWPVISIGLHPCKPKPNVYCTMLSTVVLVVIVQQNGHHSCHGSHSGVRGGMSLRGMVRSDGDIQSVQAVFLLSAQTFINITSQPSEKPTSNLERQRANNKHHNVQKSGHQPKVVFFFFTIKPH